MSSSRCVCSLVAAACISWSCIGETSASDFSKFLHSAFGETYQRSPSGTELNYHANLSRNQGPLETYITICGSDEYFVNRAQRNYDFYVQQLYQTFLGRSPRQDELRYWVVQFQRSRVNRLEMVRRFCQANSVTQLPSSLPTRPVYTPPANVAGIASELVSRASLFVSLVQTEVGYSSYGRQVVQQGRQFASVAEQYRQTVSNTASTRQQFQVAVDNLDRSLRAVEAQFYRVAWGIAQQSKCIAAAISVGYGSPDHTHWAAGAAYCPTKQLPWLCRGDRVAGCSAAICVHPPRLSVFGTSIHESLPRHTGPASSNRILRIVNATGPVTV